MLVLDTCVFIWLGLSPEEISKRAASAIEEDEITISDITFLELGFLVKKGRLSLPCELSEFTDLVMDAHGIVVTGLTGDIVQRAMGLPDDVNQDPADRIISATAICGGWQLATADKNLRKSKSVPTIW